MTKAQYQIYNRLSHKQVNRRADVTIVEESEPSVTLHVAFPGLYLTYDRQGKLVGIQTAAERGRAHQSLVVRGTQGQLTFGGEMGS